MSMDVSTVGISSVARDFLDAHDHIIVGEYIIEDDIYGGRRGKIYQVTIHSILYNEDDPRYHFHPCDDVKTYAEVLQVYTENDSHNMCFAHYALRELSSGELCFKWDNLN